MFNPALIFDEAQTTSRLPGWTDLTGTTEGHFRYRFLSSKRDPSISRNARTLAEDDLPSGHTACIGTGITVPARQEQSVGKRQRCVTQGPQVSDDVCSLLLVLQTRENHICSRQSECGV